MLQTSSARDLLRGSATSPLELWGLEGAVSDGEYNNSLVQSPLLSWVAGSDSDSGIATYQIAVGTSIGLTDVLDWTNVGHVTSYVLTGLSLSDGST